MIQVIYDVIIEKVFQGVGWAVLKAVTGGRYQGYTSDHVLGEGALGLATVAAVCYAIYRWV